MLFFKFPFHHQWRIDTDDEMEIHFENIGKNIFFLQKQNSIALNKLTLAKVYTICACDEFQRLLITHPIPNRLDLTLAKIDSNHDHGHDHGCKTCR